LDFIFKKERIRKEIGEKKEKTHKQKEEAKKTKGKGNDKSQNLSFHYLL